MHAIAFEWRAAFHFEFSHSSSNLYVYTPRARLSKYIVKNKGMTLVKVITGGPSSPEAAARAHPKRITAGF